MTQQNDPRLQFILDDHARSIDVRAELDKIIADVKAVRSGSIQDAAKAVKDGKTAGPMDIGQAIVQRKLLAEHDLQHLKIAVFEIRDHIAYEIVMKSPKARSLHPRLIQGCIKTGLGSVFTDEKVEGWRDEWLPTVWGVWVQHALRNEAARPFFCQVVPKSIEAAFEKG